MKGPSSFSSLREVVYTSCRLSRRLNRPVILLSFLLILSYLLTGVMTSGVTQVAHAAGLPAPWADGDIGSVGIAGSASYANGVFTDTGSSIIEYNYDKFHFVYQPLYGDGTIVARVTGLSGGTSAAKAGVMIRNDLNGWPASVNAMMQINAGGSLTFQRRLTAGDVTNFSSLSGTFSTPYWVKLVRSGATITGYASPDGSQWTQVGSDTLSNLTVDAWAGLAVASGTDSATSTATFDNVSVTQPTINVSANWTSNKVTLSKLAYGINGYSALNPSIMADSNYTGAISTVNAGLVRLHYGGLLNDDSTDSSAWVTTSTQSWDANHINTILNGVNNWNTSKGYKPALLIDIPGFPSWLPTYSVTDPNNGNAVVTDNLLATTQFDAYANFCAQLVKIVNVDQKRGIKYFEVPNESDNNYNQRIVDYNKNHGTSFPVKMDELATLYNKVAVAMKAVDPSILVGGPALQRPDTIAGVTTFINNTVNQSNPTTLDFLSMHGYASGSASDSDFSIYNRVYNPASNTGTMSDNMIAVRNALDTASPSKHIPLWFDEYNISWTWQTQDVRMKNYKGVVFDALSMNYFLGNGTDSLDAWNDADGIYGKIDPYSSPTYQLRPGGQFLQLMDSYGIGTRVATTTSAENTVVPMAIKTASGYTYVLINRSPNTRTVSTSFTGGPSVSGSYTQNQFSASGLTTSTVSGIGSLTLPAFSVTLLTASSSSSAFSTSFESSDPQPTWTNTVDAGGYPAGGLSNVGGICCGLTGPELGTRAETAHTGTIALMYSGNDTSSSTSYAYLKLYDLSSRNITVGANTTLSYWIYPQSSASVGLVSGSNSTCIAIDLIFSDNSNLRDSGAVDQHGHRAHPAYQCQTLTMDTWNQVIVNLGSVKSGLNIVRLDVGYDQPANTGGYRGYIDDIQISG